MRDKKLMTPHEAEIDRLLQIMAVLIDRLGGEAIISRQELEMFFDVPVLSRAISPDYIRFRVDYPDEMVISLEDTEPTDLPDKPPQT